MKLVKPSVEWWGPCPTIYPFEALQRIERAARICYKSEDKITDDSAPKFIANIMKRNPPHLSVVEHSNAVFRWVPSPTLLIPLDQAESILYSILRKRGKYHDVKVIDGSLYIGGNLRAWLETIQWGLQIDGGPSTRSRFVTEFHVELKALYPSIFPRLHPHKDYVPTFEYVSNPPKEMQRYTVKWICDRGVSHEIVRHRPCSFSQESTRYCDYNGKEIEFVKPAWWDENTYSQARNWEEYDNFMKSCRNSEFYYSKSRKLEQSPQQARAVLSNALKTEIVITADLEEWNWIFGLRDSAAAHPDMQVMAKMTKALFQKEGII